MTNLIVELYDALLKAGVDERLAKSAASAVMPASALEQLATKRDLAEVVAQLKTLIAELRSELIMWNVGAMAVLTAIFAAIDGLK